MSEFYNSFLLNKTTGINSTDSNSYNSKLSGFKDLLKDNIPSTLVDYSNNVSFDISYSFYKFDNTDPSWNISIGSQPSETSLLGLYGYTNKFSELFPDSHLEFYKKVELEPHRDISGTNKVWTCYDGDLNLLEHMISYNFDNSGGSYLPILEYHDNKGTEVTVDDEYKTQDIFSEPLWWLIDEENHGISFYNTDASLNQWDISRNDYNLPGSKPPRLTFYRYIGDTEINNDLNVAGTLDVSGVLLIRGLDVSKNLHQLDTSANSYNDRLDGIYLSVNR